ncbi:MAG: SpoIIE family protein phosphatase [Spartobacteria bacterium]
MTDGPRPTSERAPHELPAGLLHDLRTPLNHIIGYTEMLIEQAQEQGQDDFIPDLRKTHSAGKQLLALINDNFESVGPADTGPAMAAPPEVDLAPNEHELVGDNLENKPPAGASDAARGFVLVVDDVEANRDVLSRRLERQGYAVVKVENGRQALERLRADTFDLVLLDIMMPEMDGYEVLRRLKADEVLRHIPVIMISALSELDSVVRCIGMGAEDYLPKPFEPTLLKARIGACLEKKRARDREQELGAALHAQNKEMAIWREAQEADLAVARTTQQAIVTSPQTHLDGWGIETVYMPLIQVGGDVYGWRRMDDSSLVFWIADATGHGVAAALFTTLVALLFNQAITECTTADGILTRVNQEFCSTLRGRAFMTACCAVIKTDGELSFAGAGHPPLLLRRRDGTIETLPSRATMIGIYPALNIEPTVTTLASGDAALLYSDGLYSSKENTGERSTAETLAKSFAQTGSSADFLQSLIAQRDQTSGDGFDDDVAAIALHRE